MDKIAVLIPCYNESVTIEKVIKDWRKELPEATIYVYDNNSSDHTDQIAQNAGGVVRYEYRQGKGNVIRRMFREIDAEVYIMVDGDDTYPAEFGRKMVDMILRRHVDMVDVYKRQELLRELIQFIIMSPMLQNLFFKMKNLLHIYILNNIIEIC